jgi:hypothetical protein
MGHRHPQVEIKFLPLLVGLRDLYEWPRCPLVGTECVVPLWMSPIFILSNLSSNSAWSSFNFDSNVLTVPDVIQM